MARLPTAEIEAAARLAFGENREQCPANLMRVATPKADSLDFGASQSLFEGPYMTGDGRDPSYAVSQDGQRFLMMQPVSAGGVEVVITLNWLDELRKTRTPTK